MLRPAPSSPPALPDRRALPAWVTPELVARTRATWQPYYPDPLTDDDAVQMLLTVAHLYRVLAGDNDDGGTPPEDRDRENEAPEQG